MKQILSGAICLDRIPADKKWKSKSGETWASVTIYVEPEADKHGNHAAITIEQSKDERENKTPRTYIGNLKRVWPKDAPPNRNTEAF